MEDGITTFKEGETWYAKGYVKEDDNPTGLRQIIKQGRTETEARNMLMESLSYCRSTGCKRCNDNGCPVCENEKHPNLKD